MTAKLTPFSYYVGAIYHGFLTGKFYHYTLTINFLLWVFDGQNGEELFIKHFGWDFLLFNAWVVKKDLNKWLFRFLIVLYLLVWVSDMNKDNWEYWGTNSYSDWAFLAPCDPGLEGGGGLFDNWMPDRKSVVNCSHIIGKGVSLASIVKTMLKLFYFNVRWGVSPLHNPLSLNLTHSILR